MMRFVATAAAVIALMFSGVVHGLWTDRWAGEGLGDTQARLDALPLRVGDWRGEPLPPRYDFGPAVSSVTRRYVRLATGKAVTLILLGGRPGAVAACTPEVCHAAAGYDVEPPRRLRLPGPGAEFWISQLSRTGPAGQTHLQTVWAWNAGDGWRVSDNPRLAFSDRQRLYKLYLVHETSNPQEALQRGPCVEFLTDLLPELERSLTGQP